ncbi:hypothetical protein [Rhizosaccharibacter radicis]|uniref:Alpha/beta hydrolase n=1 Tax=Rhizosaccharibacter radicis TaxID=2782605 RepID=A0ABT1VXL1_9PROT|nr:hypothetical protein [Acetobacteraceae bacterium KSS12]
MPGRISRDKRPVPRHRRAMGFFAHRSHPSPHASTGAIATAALAAMVAVGANGFPGPARASAAPPPGPVAASLVEKIPLSQHPVSTIAPARMSLPGGALLPLYLSGDWDHPRPDIVRAVISIHGLFRDADNYHRTAEHALAAAGAAGTGTLLVTPQFLDDVDLDRRDAARNPSAPLLRWHDQSWIDGEPASGPAPLSAFDVIDAMLARLSDPRLFPALKRIVLVGHSAGGQFVQRYALLGKGIDRLASHGIAMRFLVANPSSYAWLDRSRPVPPSPACATTDRWKYGLDSLPPYGAGRSREAIVRSYARRDITYLLGARDINPNQTLLDRSCAAEAQGPSRFARGHNFFAAFGARLAAGHQSLHDIPGVGHNGDRMTVNGCALRAVYDTGDCPAAASGGG